MAETVSGRGRARQQTTEEDGNGSLRGVKSKPTRPAPTTSVQGTKKRPKHRGIEKRQTAKLCISTEHMKVYGMTICEGAHKNT